MLTGCVAPPDWPSPLLTSTDELVVVGGGELTVLSFPPLELLNQRLFRGLEVDDGVLVLESVVVRSLVFESFRNSCVKLDVV